jgi:hypothetical protein
VKTGTFTARPSSRTSPQDWRKPACRVTIRRRWWNARPGPTRG